MFDVLDVSKWNEVTDYVAMVKTVKGVIIRVGYRAMKTGVLYMDPKFETHYNNLKDKVGIGIYWFTNAISETEAIQEAQYVLKVIDEYKIKLDFPIMIDSEYSNNQHNGRADNLTKSKRTDVVVAFCDTIINVGYKAGIYASDDWFVSRLEYTRVDKYPKWVASYSKAPTRVKSYCAWQYTSRSKEAGVKYYGSVTGMDRSHWYSNPSDISSVATGGLVATETIEDKSPVASVTPVSIDTVSTTKTTTINIDTSKNFNLTKGASFIAPDRKIGIYAKPDEQVAYKQLVPGKTYYVHSTTIEKGKLRVATSQNAFIGTGYVYYNDISSLLTSEVSAAEKITDIIDKATREFAAGEEIVLSNVDMFSSSSKTTPIRQLTGTYYVWSPENHAGRIRITNSKDNVGVRGKVTAWINIKDI